MVPGPIKLKPHAESTAQRCWSKIFWWCHSVLMGDALLQRLMTPNVWLFEILYLPPVDNGTCSGYRIGFWYHEKRVYGVNCVRSRRQSLLTFFLPNTIYPDTGGTLLDRYTHETRWTIFLMIGRLHLLKFYGWRRSHLRKKLLRFSGATTVRIQCPFFKT